MGSTFSKWNIKWKLPTVLDILLITETKIDSSFPTAQFQIEGFTTPYRLDRDTNGGGTLLYVNNNNNRKLGIVLTL